MRQPFSRPLVLVVCALALSLTSCSSENKGKIVGKWKIKPPPDAKDSDVKVMEFLKVYSYIEFKEDGTFSRGLTSDDPEALKEAHKLYAKLGQTMPEVKGTYKLLMGKGVELSNLEGEGSGQNKGRTEVTINGDALSLKARDMTLECTRVK